MYWAVYSIPVGIGGRQLDQMAEVAHQDQLQLPRGPGAAQCRVSLSLSLMPATHAMLPITTPSLQD